MGMPMAFGNVPAFLTRPSTAAFRRAGPSKPHRRTVVAQLSGRICIFVCVCILSKGRKDDG